MSKLDRLDQRLSAVENTVVDGETEFEALSELSEVAETVEQLEERFDTLENRIAKIEAATQSLEGYVGNIQSVNEDVEQEADAAIAAIERLEQQFEDFRGQLHMYEQRASVDTIEQLTRRVEKLENDVEKADSASNGDETMFTFDSSGAANSTTTNEHRTNGSGEQNANTIQNTLDRQPSVSQSESDQSVGDQSIDESETPSQTLDLSGGECESGSTATDDVNDSISDDLNLGPADSRNWDGDEIETEDTRESVRDRLKGLVSRNG